MDSRTSRFRKIHLLSLAGIVGSACTVLFAQGSADEMVPAKLVAEQPVIQIHGDRPGAAQDVQQDLSARLPPKQAGNDFGYYRFRF